MKIALAYPWTDGDGETHDPDSVVDVPVNVGKALVRDGRARAVTGEVEAGAQAGAQAGAGGDLFDPSKATVNRVLAHLVAADDAERTRVLDAERAGKAREGVLSFIDSGESTS